MTSLPGYDAYRRQQEEQLGDLFDSRPLFQKVLSRLEEREVGSEEDMINIARAVEVLCQEQPVKIKPVPGAGEEVTTTRYIHIISESLSMLEFTQDLRTKYRQVSPLFYQWLQFSDLNTTVGLAALAEHSWTPENNEAKKNLLQLWSDLRRSGDSEYWTRKLRSELEARRRRPQGIVLLGGEQTDAEHQLIVEFQTEETII